MTTALEALRSLGVSAERGLSEEGALQRLRREGPNEVAERSTHPLARLAKKLWGLSAWMLEAIIVLSILLHKPVDASVAFALLVINAVIGFAQEQRASTALASIRSRLQVNARVLRDGAWRAVSARNLVTGDVVRLRAGDLVPADAQVFDGELRVDHSALTGESRDVEKAKDGIVQSGSVIRAGEASAVIVATGSNSSFGRTASLVASAAPKLHVESVVQRVVRWILFIVGVLVAVAVAGALVTGVPSTEIFPLALVLLMGAVPVALPVMFTVSMAVGSLELAKKGVLVTRLAALEDAATMDVLVADKTGTLTTNKLAVVALIAVPPFSQDDVVAAGALASSAADQDPIDVAFLAAAHARGLDGGRVKLVRFAPFSPETRRTEAVAEVDGHRLLAMKGALHTIAAAAAVDARDVASLEARAAVAGTRIIAVARADEPDALRFVGVALLRDPTRPDSRALVDHLRASGVSVKMLTGDALPVARAIGGELGLADIAAAADLRAGASSASLSHDGFAEVFPEDKLSVVKALQAAGHVVGMTGDGVNDAPALRQAEVGIAVASATDVAKGAASAVLTTEGMAGIVDLVHGGRAIYQRVLTWIINKISGTVLKTGFVVIALFATGELAVSALVMVLLIFMTDFVKLALATDRVRPSPAPETWRIGPLVGVAVVLGVAMLAEALAVYVVVSRASHLAGPQLHTLAFEVLLFFSLAALVSIRERRAFFRSRPSWLLAGLLMADAVAAATIGVVGLGDLGPLPLATTGIVAACAALCCLGPNDLLKSVLIARVWTRRRAAPRIPG